MKKILLIIRSPFLDRIPSLKTLIWNLLEEKKYKVILVSSKNDKFPLLTISHENLEIVSVKERSSLFGLPTFIKIICVCIRTLLKNRIHFIIGGDRFGNIISHYLRLPYKVSRIFFMLEYPALKPLTRSEKMEIKALQCSDAIILHDKWHKEFIEMNFNISNREVYFLPNASFTPVYKGNSDYMRNKFNIKDKFLILHSGGIGEWFDSKALALSTINWPDDYRLVFHTSHKVYDDPYFEDIVNNNKLTKVLYSTQPVPTDKLDELVASCDIGIAIYNESVLDYRAKYMGLAAGKIGNYLKCGVPVIATRLPSLKYIEDYDCGILIDNLNNLPEAINTIKNNKNKYSNNAYRCYDELWHPKKYLASISNIFKNKK